MYNLLLLRNHPKAKKFLSILLMLTLLLSSAISAPVYAAVSISWTQVGEDLSEAGLDAAQTVLSISNGIPYVAYLEPATSGGSAEARSGGSTNDSTVGKAVVKKLSGDIWETVDLGDNHEPDGFVTDATILKYDFEVYDGIPYLAYLSTDYDMMTLALMQYDEEYGWVTLWDEYSSVNNHLANANDLALDVSSGVPYIAWSTPEYIACLEYTGNEDGFQYFDETIVVPSAQSLSIQCDMSEGFIFASFRTDTGNVEVYKNLRTALTQNWVSVGETAVSTNGTEPYLYVFENIPLITYAEIDGSSSSCIVKMLVNSHWVPLGAPINDSKVTNPSIYMDDDDDDTLFLAYQGPSSFAIVKKFNPQNQSWNPVSGTNSYASTYIVSGLSLSALDGNPYVSYIQSDHVMVMNYIPDEGPGGGTGEEPGGEPVEVPSITTQPQDKTVLEGSSVSFSVSTSGNTSLTYQWHKDGEDIPGATSSYYSISNAVSSDAGHYSCSITNAGGTVKTREALLTVKEAETLGLTAKAGNKKVTLTWDSFPGATRYKVYLNNSLYSDVDGNSYDVRYLVNGTTYQFEVRALSDGTTFIGSSAKISAAPIGVPGAPTNIAATSGNGQATVTFQEPADHGDSPITGYTVTSSPGGIKASGAGTSITVTGLSNGTSYTFIVNAMNSLGEGDDSVPSNAVTPVAPGSHSGGSKGGITSNTPTQSESSTVIVNGVAKAAGTSQITTDKEGKKTTTVTVDSERLKEILASEKSGATVIIPVKNGSAAAKGILTGEMVKNMESKAAVLVIQTDRVSYTLPASQINIDKVSGQLGKDVSLSEIAVVITVSEPAGNMSKVIENAVKQGGFSVIAPSIDFNISGTYKGSTVNVSAFNAYVDRLVAIPAGVDPEKITTGIVVTPKGNTYHVPTQVVIINGVYYAKINSLTNSTYSVIWNPIEFADVAKHWSKDSVNNMGSRMVVNGVGGSNYDPNRSITRAEFAAIIVRALGLAPGSGTTSFSDVASSAWYAGYIETASSYGIIKGYDNGGFGPQDTISREQAMAMLARAMKITGLETALTAKDVNQLTAAYADGSSISSYAKEASAACLKSGIVAGRSNSTIAPKSSVTRAEVAAMMERLLQKSDLI